MKQSEFLTTMRPSYRAVYRLKKDIHVNTYVFGSYCDTEIHAQDKGYNLPKGAEMYVTSYGMDITGKRHAMCFRNPRKLFKGKNATKRWAYIPYSYLEYVRDEKYTY